jgi:hypothetical protein
MKKLYYYLFLTPLLFAINVQGNDINSSNKDSSINNIKLKYGDKGWEMNYNNQFLMQMQWRLQFRTQINSSDPLLFIGEEDDNSGTFNVQRARLKVGGYAYQSYIKYYLEYDFPSGYLLNWEFTLSKFKALQLKVGQWKIKYNIERFISSGKQQLVERSISNRYFTFDRQMGVELLGDLFENKAISSSYNIGVFNGNGRMNQNDDGEMLIFGRYQWNFMKKPMKLSYCDIERVKTPQGYIAFAYAHNISEYTRFSSDGGGQLPGYSSGNKTQYEINQYNLELMFKYRGLSLSSENHIKDINDRVNNIYSQIYGGYVIAGYFFNEIIDFIPKQLEFNLRYAIVSNKTFFEQPINEYSIGFNWFFKNHLNKLTTDLSYIKNQDFIIGENNYRARLQWDISF